MRLATDLHARRGRITRALLLSLIGGLPAAVLVPPASAQTHAPPSVDLPFRYDSGYGENGGAGLDVVLSFPVHVEDASWLRLRFSKVRLSGDPRAGTGSILRITSMEDAAEQRQNAIHIEQWGRASAYFNGGAVLVEVLSYPNTGRNRVVLETITAGIRSHDKSQCGTTDDRVLSDDDRVSRVMPIGCTSWLINDDCGCLLTAGHCAGGTTTIEFNVPPSAADGTIRHPRPEDQYAVDTNSVQFASHGVGDDWCYFGVFPNANTGLMPRYVQGHAFVVVSPPAYASGQEITITGYGQDFDDPTHNQAQQTHTGPRMSAGGTILEYEVDTEGGNSGSPVILTSTDHGIGIHTDGGCNPPTDGNTGTGLDNGGLQAALDNPLGICATPPASVTYRNAGSNPVSYEAVTLPVLGTTYTGTVALAATTGHDLALLVGYATSLTLTLGGGQTLLVNVADPSGEVLGQSFLSGPLAAYDLPLPPDLAFAGFGVSTQALHFGGVQPFALSNAQDLVLGLCGGGFNEMAYVPAGEYGMGDHHGEGDADERPVHTVYIDAFWIDVYEVTNQKYAAYLNTAYSQGRVAVSGNIVYQVGGAGQALCDTTASSSTSRITWNGSTFGVTPGKEQHPMVDVSWYGACTYANQRSRDEGLTPCYDETTWDCDWNASGYRLPTEAEWEKAARGGEYHPYYRYPWGEAVDGSKANYWASGDPYETGPYPWTTPVGYYDGNQVPAGVDMANGFGLYDMAGNVWEWCNDWYSSTYYSSHPYDNPTGPPTGVHRVQRGGSWNFGPLLLRSAFRSYNGFPSDRGALSGFRVLAVRP